jgi:ornithine cyclodeaminase/alanine dehydrogenase-like protein (mu-crystallin family)
VNLPYLTAEQLGPVAAIDALEAVLRGGFDPEADPARTFVDLRRGELILMPSEVGEHLAVKLVTVGGDPRIQGVVVLFDARTLAPAALVDGIALTNLRTAAVSALAVRHLSDFDVQRLLVYGTGPQAHAHVEAIKLIRPVEHIDVVGREGAPDEVVAAADVICCCTSSATPLFDGALVKDGAVVVAIGSHDPVRRETDDALVARSTVVVESRVSALREAGDVIGAVESGALDRDALVTLAELVRGEASPGPGPRLFKSTGMAWEDAVVAAAVLAAAT